jgi:hypothetical protein
MRAFMLLFFMGRRRVPYSNPGERKRGYKARGRRRRAEAIKK